MNIRPPAGCAFVEPLSRFQEKEMMILIPETARYNNQPVGKVLDVTLYPEGQLFKVWERHGEKAELVDRLAYLQNPQYADLIGKVVLCELSVQFEQLPLRKVRLEHILCVLEGDSTSISSDALQGLVGRCPWCKSAGEANILLDPAGYCIKCRRNAKGDVWKLDENGMPEVRDDDSFGEYLTETHPGVSGWTQPSGKITVSMHIPKRKVLSGR